jgi:hypothetical protein
MVDPHRFLMNYYFLIPTRVDVVHDPWNTEEMLMYNMFQFNFATIQQD